MKNEPQIYGLKSNKKLIYIGKTHCTNNKGNLIKSELRVIYRNSKLKKLVVNNKDVEIVPIQNTDLIKWYDDRNTQAHKKFIEGEKHLVNDPWILEGKNGYWEDKIRDEHTIKRLGESKHKSVSQYDKNGCLIKIWKSAKEIGLTVFKDYKVVNGSSSSKIYDLINAKQLKNKFHFDFYWFKNEDLFIYFKVIPKKINIEKILLVEKAQKKERNKNRKIGISKVYSVKRYSLEGVLIKKYPSVKHAGKDVGLHHTTIARACRFVKPLKGELWKYGKKVNQDK